MNAAHLAKFYEAGKVFTPSAPIDDYSLFAGREKEIHRVISGKLVVNPIEQSITVQKPEADTGTVTFHIVMAIEKATLPAFGEYSIDLAIDRICLASAPLYYRKTA